LLESINTVEKMTAGKNPRNFKKKGQKKKVTHSPRRNGTMFTFPPFST